MLYKNCLYFLLYFGDCLAHNKLIKKVKQKIVRLYLKRSLNARSGLLPYNQRNYFCDTSRHSVLTFGWDIPCRHLFLAWLDTQRYVDPGFWSCNHSHMIGEVAGLEHVHQSNIPVSHPVTAGPKEIWPVCSMFAIINYNFCYMSCCIVLS